MTPAPSRGTTGPCWTPPTPTPEAGQGPWCDVGDMRTWWVVTEDPDDPAAAFAAIRSADAEVFPCYFAWQATIEPVALRWVAPEDRNEETEVVEAPHHDEDTTAKAWRITVEDA